MIVHIIPYSPTIHNATYNNKFIEIYYIAHNFEHKILLIVQRVVYNIVLLLFSGWLTINSTNFNETTHSICVGYFLKFLMTLMDCNLKINQSININIYDKTVSINNVRVIVITYIYVHTLQHHISLFLPYFTIFGEMIFSCPNPIIYIWFQVKSI